MDPEVIEYVDGYTNEVVNRTPRDEAPPNARAVYMKDGVEVPTREEADQVIPIVRVVATPLDQEDRPVPRSEADHMVVREYDALGECRRTTVMHRRVKG